MEFTNAAEFLKEKGMLTPTEKKVEPAATQVKAEIKVEANPDKERLNSALENPVDKVDVPEDVVDTTTEKIDLSKEPEAGLSLQDRAKAESKVIKEIKKAEKKEAAEDVAKNWFDDDKEVVSENEKTKPNYEIPADTKAKLDEYESFLRDPEMEAIIAAKKSGKNLFDFIEEIKPVDYSKLSPSELNEIRLKRLGVTDDEIKEAMEIFNELPKWEQIEKVASVKTSLEQEQGERLKKFPKDVARQTEARNNLIKKAELDLDKKLDSILEKEMYGLKITENEQKVIRETALNGRAFFKEDGSLDAEETIDYALWKNFKKEIVRANITKARASAMEETFKERVRPTAKVIETSRIPAVSEDEKAQEAKKSFLAKRAGQAA